ncbi:unnamed protein product [Peniophora sp. CBMAI 1063]|nr:unnamed protein product [Peniophora sp. CBMAI 1063]
MMVGVPVRPTTHLKAASYYHMYLAAGFPVTGRIRAANVALDLCMRVRHADVRISLVQGSQQRLDPFGCNDTQIAGTSHSRMMIAHNTFIWFGSVL